MSRFVFKSYSFDAPSLTAHFTYEFDDGRTFHEQTTFQAAENYNIDVLDKALFLAFIVSGVSYYKAFPTRDVVVDVALDDWQADFFSRVYQEGLGQFAFENNMKRDDLAHFNGYSEANVSEARRYDGQGVLALQSGGKDSLLTASLLHDKGIDFTPWYVASGDHHPKLLDSFDTPLVIAQRSIDRDALKQASENGAKNGHVPITYIISSLALVQAILLNKKDIVVSIAHEGEEPDTQIGDLAVTHQWSKTWAAETAFAEYVAKYISPDIRIGSPLRGLSELRVAELFVQHAWQRYGLEFSSCNVANYGQGSDNTTLRWCGHCPKCANSYLLFAPFVEPDKLRRLFDGRDLFESPLLIETFKGLLGVDGVPKPFECIGEIDELRFAYHQSQTTGGYAALPFEVPTSSFDYKQTYPAQEWAAEMLQ